MAPPPLLHSSHPAEPRGMQPSVAEGPHWAQDTPGSREPRPGLTAPEHFLSFLKNALLWHNSFRKKCKGCHNLLLFYLPPICTYVTLGAIPAAKMLTFQQWQGCISPKQAKGYLLSYYLTEALRSPVSLEEQLRQGLAGACHQPRCARKPRR